MPRKGRTGAQRTCHLVTVEPWYNDCVAVLHQRARLPAEMRAVGTPRRNRPANQTPQSNHKLRAPAQPIKPTYKTPSKVTFDPGSTFIS